MSALEFPQNQGVGRPTTMSRPFDDAKLLQQFAGDSQIFAEVVVDAHGVQRDGAGVLEPLLAAECLAEIREEVPLDGADGEPLAVARPVHVVAGVAPRQDSVTRRRADR